MQKLDAHIVTCVVGSLCSMGAGKSRDSSAGCACLACAPMMLDGPMTASPPAANVPKSPSPPLCESSSSSPTRCFATIASGPQKQLDHNGYSSFTMPRAPGGYKSHRDEWQIFYCHRPITDLPLPPPSRTMSSGMSPYAVIYFG